MTLGLVVVLQDLGALFIQEGTLNVHVRVQVALENEVRVTSQELQVRAQVELGQVLAESLSFGVQAVQVVEVSLALALVGELHGNVLFQLVMVNVQDELAHHLLGIWKDVFYEFPTVLAKRHDLLEDILATIKLLLLDLLNESINALVIPEKKKRNELIVISSHLKSTNPLKWLRVRAMSFIRLLSPDR